VRIPHLDSPRLLGLGLLAGLVLAGVGTASAAAPAFAHDNVVSSRPYNSEVVTKPIDTVTVTFSDELLTLGSSTSGFAIEVTDADGGHHESGCVTVTGSDASTGVALGEAGRYDVTWRVVADDGHPISGTYSFTWQPKAVTVAAPAYSGPPDCGAAWSGIPAAASQVGDSSTPQPGQTAPSGQVGEGGQTGGAETATSEPEPTMTILSAVPADSNDDSGLALPLTIVAGVGALAALSAVLFYVVRRARGDHSPRS
jgi:methionine-rich copper-binding protein CopC